MRKSLIITCLTLGMAAILFFGCGGEPGEREFKRGLKEVARGNYVRARTLLEKSLSLRPGSDANAAVYNYIGIISFRLGQIEQAQEAFETSRRLDPEFADPIYNLGVLMDKGGDSTRAVSLLEEAASLASTDSRAQEYIGSIYIRNGKWPEARRALFGALARAPQSGRVLTALALIEAYSGNADKAIFYLMQALEKNRDYAPALYNLGVLYERELKDREQAKAFYKKFLNVEKKGPHAEQAMQALDELTVVMTVAPTPTEPTPVEPTPAVAPMEAPATPAPETEPAPAPAATPPAATRDYQAAAREAMDRGQPKKALSICLDEADRAGRNKDYARQEKALRTAIKLCFDQPEAHYAWGRFLLAHGQNESAVRAFKQALALNPRMTLAQLALAEAAIKTGEYDAALVTLKQAVQAEPNNPDTLWALAELYDHQLGVQDRAIDMYRQFVKLFPGDPRVLKASERLKLLEPVLPAETMRKSDVRETEASMPAPRPPAEVASRTPPAQLNIKRPVFRNTKAAIQAYNRGTIYQQKEDWDRAIYYYTRAVENDDTFANAFYNLGAAYWAKGELQLAKEAYNRSLQISSDTVNARYNLALIHYKLGEKTAAIDQLRTILKLQPTYAQAYYVLGMIHSENPDTRDQAMQAYRRFLELAPNDPSAPAVRQWMELQ
jgi:tetratricopeptide (TPR) repeat protein